MTHEIPDSSENLLEAPIQLEGEEGQDGYMEPDLNPADHIVDGVDVPLKQKSINEIKREERTELTRRSPQYTEIVSDWMEYVVIPQRDDAQKDLFLLQLSARKNDVAARQFLADVAGWDDGEWRSSMWFQRYTDRAVHRQLGKLLSLPEDELIKHVERDVQLIEHVDKWEGAQDKISRAKYTQHYVRAVALQELPIILEGLNRHELGKRVLAYINSAPHSGQTESAARANLEFENPPAPETRLARAANQIRRSELPHHADNAEKNQRGDTIKLWVTVDENGKLHRDDATLVEKGAARIVRFKFRDAKTPLAPGSYLLVLRAEAINPIPGTVGGVEFQFIADRDFFHTGQTTRPIGFMRDARGGLQYILADGSSALLPPAHWGEVNRNVGKLRDTGRCDDGTFPLIRVVRETNKEMIAQPVSENEMQYRQQLDEVLAQYAMPPEGRENYWFSKGNKWPPGFHSDVLTRELRGGQSFRENARELIKKNTEEFPIPMVVSMKAGQISRGFQRVIAGFEAEAEKDQVNLVLTRAAKDAERAFNAISHARNSGMDLPVAVEQAYFDEYVRFFTLLHQFDEQYKGQNRPLFFSSDLDGETSIQLFNSVGIHTLVVPFVPDNSRVQRGKYAAYIERAVHVDAHHGSGKLIIPEGHAYRNADGEQEILPQGVSVVLDENLPDFNSAVGATESFLQDLGFLSMDMEHNADPLVRARFYLIRFVDAIDSHSGPLATKNGRARVFNGDLSKPYDTRVDYRRSIYGLSDNVLNTPEIGRADLVAQFFDAVVPGIEAQILKEDAMQGKKNMDPDVGPLWRRVLERLVDVDALDWIEKNAAPEDTPSITKEANFKYDMSICGMHNLIEGGFVAQTRFGKTLFDPFGFVPSRGMAPFTVGANPVYGLPQFDAFISYNLEGKMCSIIVSGDNLDAQGNPILIPHDLLMNSSGTGQKVTRIIGGVMAVMNQSSRDRLTGIEELLRAVHARLEGGRPGELPRGLQNMLDIEHGIDIQTRKASSATPLEVYKKYRKWARNLTPHDIAARKSHDAERRAGRGPAASQKERAATETIQEETRHAKPQELAPPEESHTENISVHSPIRKAIDALRKPETRETVRSKELRIELAGLVEQASRRRLSGVSDEELDRLTHEIEAAKRFMIEDARYLIGRGAQQRLKTTAEDKKLAIESGVTLRELYEMRFEIFAEARGLSAYWDILDEEHGKDVMVARWLSQLPR